MQVDCVMERTHFIGIMTTFKKVNTSFKILILISVHSFQCSDVCLLLAFNFTFLFCSSACFHSFKCNATDECKDKIPKMRLNMNKLLLDLSILAVYDSIIKYFFLSYNTTHVLLFYFALKTQYLNCKKKMLSVLACLQNKVAGLPV